MNLFNFIFLKDKFSIHRGNLGKYVFFSESLGKFFELKFLFARIFKREYLKRSQEAMHWYAKKLCEAAIKSSFIIFLNDVWIFILGGVWCYGYGTTTMLAISTIHARLDSSQWNSLYEKYSISCPPKNVSYQLVVSLLSTIRSRPYCSLLQSWSNSLLAVGPSFHPQR